MEEFSTINTKNEANTLPFKVADEIIRMRQRIATMPIELNGITQILKSLERLEHELNMLDFELPDLLNKSYHEGMTVKARFIPSKELSPGEKIITKVIKPQINYKGQLVQMGEVEVSTGE